MTSLWARRRFISLASRLLAQPLVQAQIRENTKAPHHWPLWREYIGDQRIPLKQANQAENISIWWRRHVDLWFNLHTYQNTYSGGDVFSVFFCNRWSYINNLTIESCHNGNCRCSLWWQILNHRPLLTNRTADSMVILAMCWIYPSVNRL